ncbi:uncharacterized protein LOC116267597 [Nymphaea colorata]|nr:uncharacterized protein LOC116267597 [Nymphaea colorata]
MAEFPPNVEDGELWLPSDVFPDEIYRPSRRTTAKLEQELSPCELTSSMEELAHQLAFAILDDAHHHQQHIHVPDPVPHLAPFSQEKPQRGLQGHTRLGYSGFQVWDLGKKPLQESVSKPVLSSAQLLVKPAHNQGVALGRSRSQSRGLPFRVVGSGASGFIRESGGTGVFLPRVAHSDAGTKRKPCLRTTEEQPSARNAGGGGGRDWRQLGGDVNSIQSSRRYQHHLHHHPSDIALPSEWTY